MLLPSSTPKTKLHHTRHTASGRSRPASIKSNEINMIAQSIWLERNSRPRCEGVRSGWKWCLRGVFVCRSQKRCNQARVRCILENGAEIYDVDYIFFSLLKCVPLDVSFLFVSNVGIPAASQILWPFSGKTYAVPLSLPRHSSFENFAPMSKEAACAVSFSVVVSGSF